MWDYDGDEWDAEIENLASAWRNEDCIDATVDRESLTPQECAILDHVAWRVANFVWNGSTSKRLSKEEAEAIKYQKDALPGAKRKVAQAIQTLRRWKKETEPLNAKEISECPPHVKRVLSTAKTRNIAGIKRLVERLDFDDEHLGKDVKSGFPDFRDPTISNTFERREIPKMGSRAHLPDSSFEVTAKELQKLGKPGFEDSLLEAVWKDLLDDAELGRYSKIETNDIAFKPALASPRTAIGQ